MNLVNSKITEQQMAALCAKRPVRMAEGGDIMTGPVRLSFAKTLHTKGAAVATATPKYGASLIFPHKNITVLMQALTAAVREFYPAVTDPGLMLDRFNKAHAVRDGALKVSAAEGGRAVDGKTTSGYTVGFPWLSPKSGNAIPCYHNVRGTWVPAMPDEIAKIFYSGCWVDAKVKIIKNQASSPGVSLGLQGVWKLADDNTFGGGGASAGEGGDAGDAFAAEDPNQIMKPSETVDWDDEVPF